MAAFKKCPWTPEEDMRLVTYISRYGIWNWCQMPKNAGLSRSGKSCRLRWMNYLDPQVKRGNYTQEEDEIIINMRGVGAGWSAIAARLSGRTDNEIKNRWHTHLKKRIANNVVENIEHASYLEQTDEVKTDEIMKYDYTNDHIVTPEAPNLDEDYEEGPVSSSISNYEAYSNNNNVTPTFGTSADPHTSFWREPFALDNIYEYATYVDPQFGMPRPQDWFREPFYTYYDLLYMKSRGIPNSCI